MTSCGLAAFAITRSHATEGGFRADFEVGDILIEYFGLAGDPDYDAKTRLKQRICKKHNIELVCVYAGDLVSTNRLRAKLERFLVASCLLPYYTSLGEVLLSHGGTDK